MPPPARIGAVTEQRSVAARASPVGVTAVQFAGFRPSSEEASARMRLNRKTGGKAELILRGLLRDRGLKFRIHDSTLVGCPDMAFRDDGLCVFCDGDFWHGRNWKRVAPALRRRANGEYWVAKIASNRLRDRRVTRALSKGGWRVLRLWESDVLARPTGALDEVLRILEA